MKKLILFNLQTISINIGPTWKKQLIIPFSYPGSKFTMAPRLNWFLFLIQCHRWRIERSNLWHCGEISVPVVWLPSVSVPCRIRHLLANLRTVMIVGLSGVSKSPAKRWHGEISFKVSLPKTVFNDGKYGSLTPEYILKIFPGRTSMNRK